MEWRHSVWPQAQLAYTAIQKIASTSVKTALQASIPEHRHVSGGQVSDVYRDFLHFAVVRNPFDRFVSFYQQKIVQPKHQFIPALRSLGFEQGMPFHEAAKLVGDVPDESADRHIRSQAFVLLDNRGRLRPDLVLRFERMGREWSLLQRIVHARSGVELVDLPHMTVSRHHAWSEYYCDETLDLIFERYRKDFELLGYARGAEPGLPRSIAGVDTAVERVVRKGATGVLDLSTPSANRIESLDARGCVYLGLRGKSSVGQLAGLRAVREGRIPDSVFDVLVLPSTKRRESESVEELRRRFEVTGRRVIETDSWVYRMPTTTQTPPEMAGTPNL